MVAAAGEQKVAITTTGVLDVREDDEGGVLVMSGTATAGGLSAFVPQALIERATARAHCGGSVASPSSMRVAPLSACQCGDGRDPETLAEIVPFTERLPYYPTSRILLETSSDSKWDDLSMRVVDCLHRLALDSAA